MYSVSSQSCYFVLPVQFVFWL
uniref:Uncharacterized protein n=1 Tax=Anguilla anguilla TaxID=7936 RepID=A0A0E9VHF2_ANGAN